MRRGTFGYAPVSAVPELLSSELGGPMFALSRLCGMCRFRPESSALCGEIQVRFYTQRESGDAARRKARRLRDPKSAKGTAALDEVVDTSTCCAHHLDIEEAALRRTPSALVPCQATFALSPTGALGRAPRDSTAARYRMVCGRGNAAHEPP